MNLKTIQKVLSLSDERTDALFKPKQKIVLRKLLSGEVLNDNEKRYLRGSIRNKIEMLSSLIEDEDDNPLQEFTKGIGNYYISGYEALKHNGFGWYFDIKRVLIYNTIMEGTYRIPGKLIVLKRLKSIRNRDLLVDEEDGITYAGNGQILRDAISEGDIALIRECRSHVRRYGEMFMIGSENYIEEEGQVNVDPAHFGV